MKAFKKLLLGALMVGGMVACGGEAFDNDMSSRDRGGLPAPVPAINEGTITLTNRGVMSGGRSSSKRIEVSGESLTVLNTDNMAHQLVSRNCPSLNFGVLAPGQQWTLPLQSDWEGCILYDAMQPNAGRYYVTLIPAGDVPRGR